MRRAKYNHWCLNGGDHRSLVAAAELAICSSGHSGYRNMPSESADLLKPHPLWALITIKSTTDWPTPAFERCRSCHRCIAESPELAGRSPRDKCHNRRTWLTNSSTSPSSFVSFQQPSMRCATHASVTVSFGSVIGRQYLDTEVSILSWP